MQNIKWLLTLSYYVFCQTCITFYKRFYWFQADIRSLFTRATLVTSCCGGLGIRRSPVMHWDRRSCVNSLSDKDLQCLLKLDPLFGECQCLQYLYFGFSTSGCIHNCWRTQNILACHQQCSITAPIHVQFLALALGFSVLNILTCVKALRSWWYQSCLFLHWL